MHKNNFILTVLFFCTFSLQAQNDNYLTSGYYSQIYLADSLFLTHDYNQAYDILNGLFKYKDPINFFPYNEFETYVKAAYCSGRKKEASEGIRELISKYGLEWQNIQFIPILKALAEESKLRKGDYIKLRKKYDATTYPEILEKLKKMTSADQLYRSNGGFMSNREKQDSIDARIIKDLFQVMNKIGYPRFRKLGASPDASPLHRMTEGKCGILLPATG